MMSYWKRVDERLIKRGENMVGYGRRLMAEAAISRFKALFGEHLLSRKPGWMDSELKIKAFVYNMILRAATT
jgi:hypothetical protein